MTKVLRKELRNSNELEKLQDEVDRLNEYIEGIKKRESDVIKKAIKDKKLLIKKIEKLEGELSDKKKKV